MSLEKLQMVATAVVETKYKVHWLIWWNSSEIIWKDLRFPKYPTSEDMLKKWMDCASLLLTQRRVKIPTSPFLSQPPYSKNKSQVFVINGSIFKQQRFFLEVRKFVGSCSSSRSWRSHSVPSLREASDLVIADLSEGLSVPTVSVSSSVAPTLNMKSEDCLQKLFDFADEILHNNGTLLFFFHLIMERSLRTLRGFMITLVLLYARNGWESISCPLARQRFAIPSRTYSISFFSSGIHGPWTPCLRLLHLPFVMYQSWWRMMWTLTSMTHWLIFVPIHLWMCSTVKRPNREEWVFQFMLHDGSDHSRGLWLLMLQLPLVWISLLWCP